MGDFPFHKLKHFTLLILDVMMNVEYEDAYEFMFNINKSGREFLVNNFTTLRNGFMNDGLIDLCFSDDPDEQFNNYDLLEKQYLLALNRKVYNRILTFNLT